jgi:predicted ATP-dependent endonuclease of OLD family
VIDQLDELAEYETGDPIKQAREILFQRRPEVLLFTDERRLLQSEYDLSAVVNEPPAVLSNLASLADLDLRSLYTAASANDFAQVGSTEERANEQLRQVFDVAWSQSNVHVHFRVDGLTLHVQVREPDARYSSIAERSDGLRQFVSLVAFTAQQPSEYGLILLIDEAETHLHYDAQADLIHSP